MDAKAEANVRAVITRGGTGAQPARVLVALDAFGGPANPSRIAGWQWVPLGQIDGLTGLDDASASLVRDWLNDLGRSSVGASRGEHAALATLVRALPAACAALVACGVPYGLERGGKAGTTGWH